MIHLRGIRNLWLGTRRSKYGSRFQNDFHRQKSQLNLVNCFEKRSTNVLYFRDNKTVSWVVTVDGPVRMSLYRSVRLVRSIGTSNNQGIPVSVPVTSSQRLWLVSWNIHWNFEGFDMFIYMYIWRFFCYIHEDVWTKRSTIHMNIHSLTQWTNYLLTSKFFWYPVLAAFQRKLS